MTEKLPSIDDFYEELPSVDEFIIEEKLPSVDQVIVEGKLPSVDEVIIEEKLPSVDEYIEPPRPEEEIADAIRQSEENEKEIIDTAPCSIEEQYDGVIKLIFKWLSSCEHLFGFENLSGYGMTRIYGFLAERFMSYWFKKNTKFSTLPIIFKDISEID